LIEDQNQRPGSPAGPIRVDAGFALNLATAYYTACRGKGTQKGKQGPWALPLGPPRPRLPPSGFL